MRFVKPYKVIFFVSIFFSISLGILSVSRPIIIEYTVDHFIIGAGSRNVIEVYPYHDWFTIIRIYYAVSIYVRSQLDWSIGY